MRLVFFTTDCLLWLLALVTFGSLLYVRTQPHLVAPWQYILRRPTIMIALIILLVFISIAYLDSVHFTVSSQKTKEIKSCLDLLLAPLIAHNEVTYSSPFAMESFVPSNIQTVAGVQRYFEPLQYATGQIAMLFFTMKAFVLSLCVILLIGYCLVLHLHHHYHLSWNQAVGSLLLHPQHLHWPWRSILLTLAVISFIAFFTAYLIWETHPFGTDQVGRDILYLTLKSIRTALVIGTITALVMLPFALLLGIAAGYFSGLIDDVIQFLYTTLSSIPGVLLIAASVLAMQIFMENHIAWFTSVEQKADLRLLILCMILGVTSWTSLCRLLRAETLKVREMDYIAAARVLNVSHFRILLRHILPNVSYIVLITIALDFSGLVLAEAVLSYVGVGVDPLTYSFGNMINTARLEMARTPAVWWPLAAAFISMLMLVMSANLIADAIREAFDPKLRGQK